MGTIFIADLLELVGGVVIAYTVIAVHHRILHEHSIDAKVLRTMRQEQFFAAFGIVLLILGFVIRHTT